MFDLKYRGKIISHPLNRDMIKATILEPIFREKFQIPISDDVICKLLDARTIEAENMKGTKTVVL